MAEAAWEVIDHVEEADILTIASSLGTPVPTRSGGPLVDILKPRDSSRHASPTKTNGIGEFPLHVDGSHRPVPPRWVLLLGARPSARATTLLARASIRFSPDEREVLRRGTVLVLNGRKSFVSTLLDDQDRFLRFDPGCMRPASRSGHSAWVVLQDHLASAAKTEIVLRDGQLLVLDNWHCLHGRGSGTNDYDRTLLRVTVEVPS